MEVLLDTKSLYLACQVIPDKPILVTIASQRAKELARGANPMVNIDREDRTKYLDIALREIAEGKLYYEMGED
ncbi:MAG: DNA-directed RNA polymerase subunit omega [Lentisphaeria bacterium]|nr:DNA-directed RNA polymerase subunit omega [Lentisphaeria bacterium]